MGRTYRANHGSNRRWEVDVQLNWPIHSCKYFSFNASCSSKLSLQVEQMDVYLLHLGFYILLPATCLFWSSIYIQEDHTGPAEVWGCATVENNWQTHACTHKPQYINISSTLGICRLLSCCCHLRMVSSRNNQMLTLPTRTHLPTWIVRLCSVELRSCSSSLMRRGL